MTKMLSQAQPDFLLSVAFLGREDGYYPPYVGRWGGRALHGRKHTLSRCIDVGVESDVVVSLERLCNLFEHQFF